MNDRAFRSARHDHLEITYPSDDAPPWLRPSVRATRRQLEAERICCDGQCTEGEPCARVSLEPIESVEAEHPWLWLVFLAAAVLVAAIPYFARRLHALV